MDVDEDEEKQEGGGGGEEGWGGGGREGGRGLWQIFYLKAKAGRGTLRFSREQSCPPQFQEGPLRCDPLFSNEHN